jgi:hypothetical protein
MFLPPGSAVPRVAAPVQKVARPEGTLLTTSPQKAAAFAGARQVGDPLVAGLLGYPETKRQALASGNPRIVQAEDRAGRPIHQMAASPAGTPAALRAAAAQVPKGGRVRVATPLQTVVNRLRGK